LAIGEIVGAVIGALLLIIVAYLLVGSVLVASETVVNAQKDTTLRHEARIGTAFTISGKLNTSSEITYNISNTGTEIISDFNHTEVLVKGTGAYQLCRYDTVGGTSGTWNIANYYPTLDKIHPHELDPGETFRLRVTFSGGPPVWFQMTTSNGVYASAYV
jgi:flagellar protein FlaF